MKKTLSIAAIIAAMTAPAFANTAGLQMEVDRHVNGADVSLLTQDEMAELENLVQQGDSFSERQARIDSFLRNAGAIDVERGQTFMWSDEQVSKLAIEVRRFGDYDIDELSQAEKLELMNIIYSGGSNSEKDKRISALFS